MYKVKMLLWKAGPHEKDELFEEGSGVNTIAGNDVATRSEASVPHTRSKRTKGTRKATKAGKSTKKAS